MGLKIMGVRQLRDELAGVLDELSVSGEVIVTQRGEGRAVLIDLERYNQLVERVEFLEDSLDALETSRRGARPARDLK